MRRRFAGSAGIACPQPFFAGFLEDGTPFVGPYGRARQERGDPRPEIADITPFRGGLDDMEPLDNTSPAMPFGARLDSGPGRGVVVKKGTRFK